ncbi:flagellar biosynthetic protein FliR [Bacillus sp. FJAT-44742]|uniref:flagellar biosynthetic protein FliR n=1 Tax=Bacillus sp. FJAT-44742 TaxID=2014005 RepID=UPI001E37132C|nr:flagellar biosynthetic protein FliR [Bacillus sp. FJAT-44742]
MEWINQFPAFLLIFVRVLAFFTTMPIFAYRNVPNTFKIGLAVFMAFTMMFTVDVPELAINAEYFLLVIKEALVGLLVGLVASMLIYAVQVAGMFIDILMGFLVANVIDPQTGAQSPLTGGFLYAFTVLFLLAVDGHHLLLDGVYYSYEFVPLEQLFLPFGNGSIAYFALTTFTTMFIIAFQMAFPIIGCLFLVDVALGMMSRAVPQMNVFVVGLPLKIFLGLPLLAIMLPGFFSLVSYTFEEAGTAMRTLLELFGGA